VVWINQSMPAIVRSICQKYPRRRGRDTVEAFNFKIRAPARTRRPTGQLPVRKHPLTPTQQF
jgi:hypothetical protein